MESARGSGYKGKPKESKRSEYSDESDDDKKKKK